MKNRILSAALVLSSISAMAQQTGTIFLYTPEYAHLMNVSPNGKWACGEVSDGNSSALAFRMNLTTGEFLYLSSTEESYGSAVTNDGVVVGSFMSKDVTGNGAPVQTAGYWKDGSWYTLGHKDQVSDMDHGGVANAVSPDGRFIVGGLYDADNHFLPVRWIDGEFDQYYNVNNYNGNAYDVSRDGSIVAGWSWNVNRVAAYWTPELHEVNAESHSFICSVVGIAPDSKTLFCQRFNQIYTYNIETAETTPIEFATPDDDKYNYVAMFIGPDNICMGSETVESLDYLDRATIYIDHKGQYLDDYLKTLGVTLPDTINTLSRGVAISDDKNVIGSLAYVENGDGTATSSAVIILLNQNVTTREPVSLKASATAGVKSVKLSWKQPLAGAEGVVGYNVYRDGQKITPSAVNALTYIDNNVDFSTYEYTVSAVYASAESVLSEVASVEVKEGMYKAPRSLFAAQRGLNNLRLGWKAPLSSLPVKSYVDMENDAVTGFGGSGIDFEVAVKFSAEEMSAYTQDYVVYAVDFFPIIAQQAWTIKIYEDGELKYSQLVDDSKLVYGDYNKVVLTTPYQPTASKSLMIGLEVTSLASSTNNIVGFVYAHSTPGYSDLLKQVSEPDFYSLNDASVASGIGEMPCCWALGAVMAPKGAQDPETVDSYNLYSNGTQQATFASTERSAYLTGLADGEYTFELEAVYKNGEKSAREPLVFNMTADESAFKSIDNVKVDVNGSAITASWDMPADNDETFVTYSSNNPGVGLVSTTDGASYGVGATYGDDKLSKYAGYKITSFRFFPTDDATFSYNLQVNAQTVAFEEIKDYTLNKWNVVRLATPITIAEGDEVAVALYLQDVKAASSPIKLDDQVPFLGISDLYTNGSSFSSVYTSASVMGNWMIGIGIESDEVYDLPVEGFNVKIDNDYVTLEPQIETSFSYDFNTEAVEAHKIYVNAVYTVKGEVSGEVTFFTINTTGISQNMVQKLTVFPTLATSYVRASGEAESMQMVSVTGLVVAECQGNELDITSVAAGTYFVKVNAQGKTVTTKVIVEK